MLTGRSTIPAIRVDALTAQPFGLEQLAADWPFKGHRWRRDASPRALSRLAGTRLLNLLAARDARAWGVRCGDALHALAILQPLEWDSRELDLSAGRLDVILAGAAFSPAATADALVAAALDEARRLAMQHVSARVDAGDDAVIHALEGQGFRNVDVLLTFGAATDDLHPATRATAGGLRQGLPADAAAVGEIAAASFRHGRFHADPAIGPERAQDVYRRWAHACCDGGAADHVIVADLEGEVAGFVACTVQHDTAAHLAGPTGTITLIAASEHARRRGVGAALVAAAVEWFRAREVAAVEVGTQLRNAAAARLYERCGFRLVGGALSFGAAMTS